jgi:8-amino-7-oxononanoate synthase
VDQKLQNKLNKRIEEGTLRSLSSFEGFIDFYSIDYLGFSKIKSKSEKTTKYGSTGSRLISGTSNESLKAEVFLADFFNSESALIFNSGYDANLGFFSSVPQRGDFVFYDEYIHASIRDGLRLSFATSNSFKHNNLVDLELKLSKVSGVKYVVVESLYSMDGDIAPLTDIVELCTKYGAYLIVDEAHSGGVFGQLGRGLVSELKLEDKVFARIITFGKAFGSHGACVLCEKKLKKYLINFSRSFIYTTALPPDAYIRIIEVLKDESSDLERKKLKENIDYFRLKINLKWCVSDFNSPIQLIKIGDIELTKKIAEKMQLLNLAVKPIFSPTVPVGSEGLRICLHSFNKKEEIDLLIDLLC